MGKMSSLLVLQPCGWEDGETEMDVEQKWGLLGKIVMDMLLRKEVQARTESVKPKGSHIQSENPASGWFLYDFWLTCFSLEQIFTS